MLEAEKICKSYRRRMILDGVCLQVEPGTCVGIVGANGCGKTTLLSILAGAQRADSGKIRFDGKTADRSSVFADMVAYVPQENPLIPELTVKDNLSLWYRGSAGRMKKDLEGGPAALLGIGGMLRMTAGKLSGGMKKRLSIACALSNHAPFLVMDEPGAALDLECKEDIRSYLKRYMADGGAVVLTSHELEELSLCDRMYALRDGKLFEVASGLTAQELIRQFR